MNQEYGLEGTEYNTLSWIVTNITTSRLTVSKVSIPFVGYLLGQVPANMALTRIKPSRFISIFFLIWGIVTTLTFLVQHFEGMLAARFFLGVVEAPFYPGTLYLISIFCKPRHSFRLISPPIGRIRHKEETASRMAILYSANMAASSFSSLIAAGIFVGMEGVAGMSGW